jgi:hypothetical protein
MKRGKSRAPGRTAAGAPVWPGARLETTVAAVLLFAHAALVAWGIRTQSVTFDESFHVPAGVVQVLRGDARVSAVNPPFVKSLFGAAALAAGARPPADAAIATHDQWVVGESFMRRNVTGFHRVYAAARYVSLALSLLLAALVWRAARARGGPAAGLVALAVWALAPEALAHAGIASLDVAAALGWTASALALDAFLRRGRWRDWAGLALAAAFLSVTRFSALLLAPLAVLAFALYAWRGRIASPGAAVARLALLLPVVLLALALAYGEAPLTPPLRDLPLHSTRLVALRDAAPWLRLPVPATLLGGLDEQATHGQAGRLTTFVNGAALTSTLPLYFPYAIALKWPLALLVALLARAAFAVRERGRCGTGLWLPAGLFLASLAFGGVPDAGVRYALPLLPLAAIAAGDLAGRPAAELLGRGARFVPAVAGAAIVAALALEALPAGPNWLPHFNALAGSVAARERKLNDSNVDWGQGLLALRADMRRLGIRRVHLAYHGTVDPALYGIDYVPYTGGMPGPESDWLAISSYFYVGLPARLMTREGYTPRPVTYDARPLWSMPAAAHPAGCMWLFRLR